MPINISLQKRLAMLFNQFFDAIQFGGVEAVVRRK